MAFLTRAEAVRATPSRMRNARLAEAELRKAATAPLDTTFDIFLSHSSEDAIVVAGVKSLLEADGLTVYVDWIQDARLDRRRVNKESAAVLRTRMNSCRYFVYASSRSSVDSKWMPWELGYFDGRRPGRVGILPVVASGHDTFNGVEYLSLYPLIERYFLNGATRFVRVIGVAPSGQSAASLLSSLAQS